MNAQSGLDVPWLRKKKISFSCDKVRLNKKVSFNLTSKLKQTFNLKDIVNWQEGNLIKYNFRLLSIFKENLLQQNVSAP